MGGTVGRACRVTTKLTDRRSDTNDYRIQDRRDRRSSCSLQRMIFCMATSMKNANQKYPPTNSIAVDVDGTLHTNGVVNARVVEFCRTQKARGFVLTLWSARGKRYAQAAAERFGVEDLFDDIVSKPGYVLDDQGWNWIKYTHVIRSLTETLNDKLSD